MGVFIGILAYIRMFSSQNPLLAATAYRRYWAKGSPREGAHNV